MKRASVRRKTFLLVAATAAASAGIALALLRATHLWPVAAAAGLLLAAVGADAVARWNEAPLRRLGLWLEQERPRRLKFPGHDEWEGIAAALNVAVRDARRRAAQNETERLYLRAVLLTMADGVIVTDAQGGIRLLNPAAAAMFGVSEAEAAGRTVIECTMNTPLDDAIRAALRTGETQRADLEILFPELLHLRAVVSPSGNLRPAESAVTVLHDISETLRVDQVRRDFVANVSHELRTPVSGIQTLAENLLGGALEDPHIARHFSGHILQSARRLVALVDDLLGLARAEAGPPAPPTFVAVAPIARAVVAALDPAIAEKRLDVGVDVPEDAAAWADAESVRQILSNLVDNAVKYTPEGGTVDVRAERHNGSLRISVADTGIGIPREQQGRVFERFYRVDSARSRAAGGTGLGLSIVKHLAEDFGGAASVASELGQGSTFTVVLPVPPPPAEGYNDHKEVPS